MEIFKLIALTGSGLLWITWLALRFQEAGIHPVRYVLDQYARLGNGGKIVVLFLVAQMTMFGGAKHGGTNDVDDVTGTNGVEIVEGGTNDVGGVEGETDGGDGLPPLMMTGRFQLPSVGDSSSITEEDLIRGYRIESIVTNAEISYAMPSDASEVGTWSLRGAYEDVVSVDLGDFHFPLGNNLCDLLWAYTWGMVRPHLKNASNEIVAVGVPMSALPGVSRLWTAGTTNDTRLLTWENFALGRVPVSSNESSRVSAQIELFKSGDFIARSNDVESVYRRINPDDWDDDGIGNDDDDDPLAKAGEFFGPNQDMSFTSNVSAYCWVDIVVHQANARVTFVGDDSSDLPDPDFIAQAEEAYRVNLLIGKTYKVMCAMPFEVVGVSDEDIYTWWDDDGALWVNWPVDIWAMEGNGSNFRMRVVPSGLGGGFSWTRHCCSISGSGYVFTYSCNGHCGCGGCSAEGTFNYEGYSLPAYGGWCGCDGYEDPDDPHDDDPDDPPPPVGISASFSKKVIFLEDEYANTTNDVVPWYSDTSSLCCSAWGGPNGGHVTVAISGDSNLIQLNGQTLPYTCDLEPYETIGFTNTYKAASESSRFQEIEVTATFIENETGWSETACPKATAVRVEVEPATTKLGCDNRHILGIGEVLRLFVFPSSVSADIMVESGWTQNARGGDLRFICPLSNSSNGLTVNVDGDSYVPSLQVFKPQSIVCRVGRVVDFGFPIGTASGIGMQIEPIIEPESVAFTGIRIMERPTLVGATPPSGYFAAERYSDFWAHTTERGAGVWRDPNAENLFFLDTASFGEPCPSPWSEGTIDWDIEIGWGDKDAVSLVDVIEDIPMRYHQITSISSDGGVKVEKFGQWVRRMPSGSITHSSGIGD